MSQTLSERGPTTGNCVGSPYHPEFPPAPGNRRALGQRGEEAVAAWYLARGYDLVARNWRCREGELDLILRRGRLLVFCEVKTRTTANFGTPAEAVTRTKQARIRRLAARYLGESSARSDDIRFDVASVLAGQIEVYAGAF